MIGKIMSEASRSIIGMLSAKPSDMETRTANNEFSSLLLPGENRSRPASGNTAVDVVKGHGTKDGVKSDVEEFLNQLIDNDAQPVAPVITPNVAKTIGIKPPVEVSEDVAELSSDTLPLPATHPENLRFIPTVQPSSNEYISTGDEALPKAGAAFDLAKPGSDLSKHKPDNLRSTSDADVDSKLPSRAETQTAPIAADKQRSISPDTPIPNAAMSNVPAPKDAKKAPSTAAPYLDAEIVGTSKDTGITPAISAASLNLGPTRQMRDLLAPELASKGKAETSAPKQVPGSQALESKARNAAIAASKPVKAETKLPFADMDNLPAAGHLERTAELSAPVPAAPVAGAHNATTKTVGFDWNAPQFAERFASELADLNGNGDLKKFEINPRNMGRLEVSFITRGAAEIVRIEAESDAVREAIVQHSQAIQDLLKANGRADLTLRVDVRENMFAASDNGGLNPGQQGGTSGSTTDRTGERDNGSAPSSNRGAAIPAENGAEPQVPADNSRYA